MEELFDDDVDYQEEAVATIHTVGVLIAAGLLIFVGLAAYGAWCLIGVI